MREGRLTTVGLSLLWALWSPSLAGALPTAPAGSGETDGGVPPSVLLITLDTTRADALSCYGLTSGVTPFLDGIGKSGVIYRDARSVAPLTLPAHASMLTGLYPVRHALRDNGLAALSEEAVTLAERAVEAGYETAAFIASVVLKESYGLAQGFQVYDEPVQDFAKVDTHYEERPAREVASAAIRWFQARGTDRPFFVWVHFFDPHVPYEPPRELLPRARGNPYLGEVAAADQAVGEILGALGPATLKSTVILVAGDHGEALGEHSEKTHGAYCYEATIKVPFILRYPDGYRRGETSWENVSLVDVFPTLVEAMGLEVQDSVDGVSLWKKRVPATRGAYFESYYGYLNHGWSPITGWITEGMKYIYNSTPEMYDVASDPQETENLLAQRQQRARSAREAIMEISRRPRLTPRSQVDSSAVAQLQALGYASAGSHQKLPEPLEETGLPGSRESTKELELFLRANYMAEAGDLEGATALLTGLVKENPRNAAALGLLAGYLIGQEKCDEAVERLEKLLQMGDNRWTTYLNLGYCLEMGKDLQGALLQYARVLELDPTNVKALTNSVRVLEALDRKDEADSYQKRLDKLKGSRD